jgi:hypothetical protein
MATCCGRRIRSDEMTGTERNSTVKMTARKTTAGIVVIRCWYYSPPSPGTGGAFCCSPDGCDSA